MEKLKNKLQLVKPKSNAKISSNQALLKTVICQMLDEEFQPLTNDEVWNCPHVLLYTMDLIENGLKKNSDDNYKVDKKALCIDIITTVFKKWLPLSDILSKNIDFIHSKNLINVVSNVKKASVSLTHLILKD